MKLTKEKIIKFILDNKLTVYLVFYLIFLLVLSCFRYASGDESIYLQETMLISELFKKGVWIGNYGVGLHGFLFKIPVALMFIILGNPSVFVATLFTISLSIFSLILFYRILKEFFLNKEWSFWATVLLSVTLYFINMTVSFNRDIPAVFTVLLFLNLFLRKSNKWLIGLSLLLMLDAKEHVFLTVASMYGVYIVIEGIRALNKKDWLKTLGDTFEKLFSGFSLCFLWLFLMFVTSIIPINMFWASIFGVTNRSENWIESQFSTEVASSNLLDEGGKEIPKIKDMTFFTNIFYSNKGEEDISEEIDRNIQDEEQKDFECEKNKFLCGITEFVDIMLSYAGKILYPRTFSFLSIPKIIVLPSVFMAVKLLKDWWRKKDRKYLLSFILFFNILVIILRVSHGRYLLCVAPIFMLFFIEFIKEGFKDRKLSKKIFILTTIFVILGLYFESSFVLMKVILELGLLSLLWITWILSKEHKKIYKYVQTLFLASLSFGMILTAIAFSYNIGQISDYIEYEKNMEMEMIAENLSNNDVIWINAFGEEDLLDMYRKNLGTDPSWKWDLEKWIRKESLLKTYSLSNRYSFIIRDMESFKQDINLNKINKVAILESTVDGKTFSGQEYLADFEKLDWLVLEEKVELKNKVLYIFDVKD